MNPFAPRSFENRAEIAAALAPSRPKRTAIQIHWNEGAVATIEIRLRHGLALAKVCRLDPPALDAQLAWNAETKRAFSLGLRRPAN